MNGSKVSAIIKLNMKTVDMKKVYRDYKGKWVALAGPNSNKVVASSKTLDEVLKKAKEKGFDLPLVTQIPKKVLPIVGPFAFSK